MEFMPSKLIFLQIGSVNITWYALLIITGALIAYVLSYFNLKKFKYPSFYVDDIFFGVLLLGVIGARLWYCVFYNFSYYLANPLDMIAIWDGGLAIQGGLILAIAYSIFYCKRRNIDFLRVGDAIIPNVLLAQAIGRWGNYVNQECYGLEVTSSYYDGILSFLKEGMLINGTYYEPLFFYESVSCVIGFIIIVFILKRFHNKRGDLIWAYLMWYGVMRFFIEGHRQDSLMLGPIRMAQLMSIVFLIVGLLGFFGVIDKFFFKKERPAVIFDLDGTLLDTGKGIVETYRYLFNKYNRLDAFTKEVQTEVIGPALHDIFVKYFSDIDEDTLFEEYRTYNKSIFSERNKPMPHALTTLKTLQDEGYHIGIVSSKFKETIIDDLKTFDLDSYIEAIVGAGDVKKQKPDPEGLNKIIIDNKWHRDQVIYIGDSVADIEAGKAVGAYTVGFIFEPERLEALQTAKANVYIDDLSKVLEIVKEKHNFTSDLT